MIIGISINGSYNDGSLSWSLKHGQGQIKVESSTYNRDACYGPRPVRESPGFSAHTGRRRVVALRYSGCASNQKYVRESSNGSKDVLIPRAAKRSGHSVDVCHAVDRGHHVHHQPRPVSDQRSFIVVHVARINLGGWWREDLMHSSMLTRPTAKWGLKPPNRAKDVLHHNQWFSTGTQGRCGRWCEGHGHTQRGLWAKQETPERLFPQFTALTAVTKDNKFSTSQRRASMSLNHRACASVAVCRTTRRNPQLTHRTFLLSLYRSTSNSSYIHERGGLGDQPAEGVHPMYRRLLRSFRLLVHKEVPSFEVRAKRNYTHWIGLRPAANLASLTT